MNRGEIIMNTIQDLVSSFFYYDRKEDDDLGVGEIEEAVGNDEISVEEMLHVFETEIKEALK